MKRSTRPALTAALMLLLALPLTILSPALFGEATFVPFHRAVFAPDSFALPEATLRDLRERANFDLTEPTLVCAEEIRLAQRELAAGRWPAWNPFVRVGGPVFGTGISGLASPLHVHHLLMEPERAYAWTAWGSLALAGLLMLGLLRELGAGWSAATLGAVAFSWSATMAARLHLYQHYSTLLWLPASLWAIARLARGGALAAPALALVTWLAWVGGYAPAALASSLVAGAWLVWCALSKLTNGDWRAARRTVLLGGAGLATGLALAAYQLAPLAAYVSDAARDADAALLEVRRSRYLDPAGWLDLVLDAPFSTPRLNRTGGIPHDKAPLLWLLHSRAGEVGTAPLLKFTEQRLYLGAAPLLLFGLAPQRGARGFGPFALLTSVALLALAAGGSAFDALGAVLPPVRDMQPMELMAPVACLLAAGAGLGLQRAVDSRGARLALATAGLLLASVCGALAALLHSAPVETVQRHFLDALEARWGEVFAAVGRDGAAAWFGPLGPARDRLLESLVHGAAAFAIAGAGLAAVGRRPWLGSALLIAATAGELVLGAAPLNRCQPRVPGDEPVRELLRAARDRAAQGEGTFTVARVAAAPPAAAGGIAAPEDPLALPPNQLVRERIRDLNGYAFLDGRSHRPFARLYEGAQPPLLLRGRWFRAFPDDERLRHPLFDLLGVRYLLCHAPSGRPPPRHAGAEAMPPLQHDELGSFHVRERDTACPRAFVVPAAVVLGDDDAVIAAMTAPDFAPRAAALLTTDQRERVAKAPAGNGGGGEVRFRRDEPTRVSLAVSGSDGGLVVLTDAWMPGWSATVDGRPAPLLRAYTCLRAVPIPSGNCAVDIRYDAPGLHIGVLLSAVAAATWTAWVVLAARRRRRPAARSA